MATSKAHYSESTVDPPPSIGFTQLFRYATQFELFLNAVGLLAAVASGITQVFLTLLFGTLTQKFVSFGSVEAQYFQDVTNATVFREFEVAAARLRSAVALNSTHLVYLGGASLVCTFISLVIWVYTGEINTKRIREKYLQALLRQDIAYFDMIGAGEVAARIQADTNLVQESISEKVPIIVSCITVFLGGFILAYVRCWRLALAMSTILPCIAFIVGIMNKFISKRIQLSLGHVAVGGTLAEEVISSVRTAHAFSIQKCFSRLYDVHTREAHVIDAKVAMFKGAALGGFSFITYAAYALAFWFGTTLINEGHANAAQVISTLVATIFGCLSLVIMGPEMQTIAKGQAAAAKVLATIERIPTIDSSEPGGLQPNEVVGEIALENVKFNYPSRPNIPTIKGINITFAAGETVALVGASGSGKSTVVSLVERFYDPLSGSVKLDGVDIRRLNIKWLRSQFGLVSQEPTLFSTTIRKNVAYGLINTPYEHLSEKEKFKLIKEACMKANADGFINNLPNGYDTMVGERGFLLSGGQKQRVAIARAIVSNPRILLLDEATSALDTQSENVVQDALDNAAAGRTTIVIAHRLSTIKDADYIYVMGEGLVVEKGTHAELLADGNSAYARLVNAQKLRESEDDSSTLYVGEGSLIGKEDVSSVCESTIWSTSSDLSRIEKRGPDRVDEDTHNMRYLFMRIGLFNREELWRYAVGSLFAISSGMAYPSFGIIYGRAISAFSEIDPHVRQHDQNRNALWIFIIAILSAFAMAFQIYFFSSSAAILMSKMRSVSFKAILKQDIEYFDKDENKAGSLTASLIDNPRKINGLADATLGNLVQALSTLIGGSIIGLCYAWKPALVGIACIPFVITPGYLRLRVTLKGQQNKSAHENSTQIACGAVASIRTVASLTLEEECLKLYSESLEEPLRRLNKTTIWRNLLHAFSQSVLFYVTALLYWYGSRLVASAEISMTSFFMSLMAVVFGAAQARSAFVMMPDISSARNASAEIVKLIDSVPYIDAESNAGKAFQGESVRGQLRFENVYFRYPSRPGVNVLQGLSFKAEPGTFVALVGASGCGKSTVIQMIERFYDPQFGQILLDGVPIHELNVREYRKHFALVSQEPTLYSGTVRFNILLGATKPESEVTQEEIEAACRDANILDFIQSLPDGFDTQVGGKGSQLSGGQKQRIAIARALLRRPKVLLLDEATSALDSESENVVQDALDSASRGRTTIAIAHRLSTIQNADCIYFVKDGQISEAGTHEQLLSLGGDYCEYVRLQASSRK